MSVMLEEVCAARRTHRDASLPFVPRCEHHSVLVAQGDLLFLRDGQPWKSFAIVKTEVKGTYNQRELLLSEFVLPGF